MGYGGGYGGRQPGEHESTQHGVVNDITVPTLRLRGVILCDEMMIAAGILLLPICATFMDTWALPVLMFIVSVVLFRHALDNVTDPTDAAVRLFGALFMCCLVFGLGALFMKPISNRLVDAVHALWRWPPKIGYFFSKVAFIAIPFFIPIFTRTPLLAGFFKATLQDPTFPSPRTARDVEGIQYPDVYHDEAQPQAAVTFPLMALLRKTKRGAKIGLDDWFSPKKDADGLGKWGKAILEKTATFSEKGSKKTSKNPKQGSFHFGYTQDEYVKMRKIGERLGLIEKVGVGHELTETGEQVIVGAIIRTLGVDAVPEDYKHLV